MICYSDLKIDTNRERPYCHGQQACVNMSGILSTLIKFDDLDWINVWFKKVV